jgi:hypothetical protein
MPQESSEKIVIPVEQHILSGSDYLDLYKFFELRADAIKRSLFESVTWVVGFAAALLGFVVTKFQSIFLCLVGCVLCFYALLLLYDGKRHIERNWDRAKTFQGKVLNLDSLIRESSGDKKKELVPVWNQMAAVVILFILAFIVLLISFARST